MINQIRPRNMAARPLELLTENHECWKIVGRSVWRNLYESTNIRVNPVWNSILHQNVQPVCGTKPREYDHSWVWYDDQPN